MAEPREKLREILCPDSEVNDAIRILERLIELGEGAHREYAVTEDGTEKKYKILLSLNQGGLVNMLIVNGRISYQINDDGKELYNQLVKVEQH
ncbi:hypothetical protein HYT51_03085 [Candidatus Woesearchaeota archaeon]|nr:hypothetical protein [Candidatus Woesearchaeota archaeon]